MIDSAMINGSQRLMIIVQRRAHQTMPAQARTDSVKPTDLLRKGSSNNKIALATARLRTPAARLPDPSAANATKPIAAARSTLGSVRHRATKMITPARPTRRRFHPRRPIQRASMSRNANSSVRFAPDTAVRCVKPVDLKFSLSAVSKLEVSPSTRAGTSARASGRRSATDCRNPARTCSTRRSPAEGGRTTVGEPRTRSTAAISDPGSGERSRPSTMIRVPTGI